MKRLASLLAALFLGLLPARAAEGPDDRFVNAYSLIQQAETLLQNGQQTTAMERFQAAETVLKEIQRNYPSWNEKVINFRLRYVKEKMEPLAKLSKPATPPKPSQPVAPIPGVPTGPGAPPVVDSPNARVVELEQMLRQANSEKDLLTAKLREALAAQPAQLDPRELAKAEERITALEKENSLLKATLDQAKEDTANLIDPGTVADTRRKLTETKAQLENQKEIAEALTKDKRTLEREVASLKKKSTELAEKLQKASRKPSKAGAADPAEVASLRARLAVLEAQKVPYTAEELALLKPTSPGVLPTATASASAKEATKEARPARPPRRVPPGVGPLLAEAQASFAAKHYPEAEQKYKDVLRIDSTNPNALAFLAASQLEQKRIEEAEVNLRKALEEDPEHAFSLAMLGYLNLLQEKYQDALEILSRAAQLEPQNPNVQNNLGITLSKLGQSGPAETAFRKSIQFLPDFEDAHFNLAVIYANQKQPYLELARFHYNKALSGGHPKDSNLEKLLK